MAIPAGKWDTSLKDDVCSLQRAFKIGDGAVIFDLRQSAPGNYFEVSLISSSLKPRSNKPVTQFGEGSDPLRHDFSSKLASESWEGFSVSLPSDHFDHARTQDGAVPLHISKGFEEDFTLPINLKNPLLVMEQCHDELLRRWGLDPEVQRTLSRKIDQPKSYRWMDPLLRAFPRPSSGTPQRTFDMRLVVGADGVPTSCRVHGEYGNSEFEDFACEQATRKARFDPALDQNEQPVASFTIISGFVSSR